MQTATIYPGERARVFGNAQILVAATPGLENAVALDIRSLPKGGGKVPTIGSWHCHAEARNGRSRRVPYDSAVGADLRVRATGENKTRSAGVIHVTAPQVLVGSARPRRQRADAAIEEEIAKNGCALEPVFAEAIERASHQVKLYAERGLDYRSLGHSFVSRLRRALDV